MMKYRHAGATGQSPAMMQRLQISDHKPTTLDAVTRSIEVVGATENPSMVWDPARGEIVSEILLMSGCEIPVSRQIPLTIDHERDAGSVIGSFADMRIEGDKLVGRAVFSSAADAEPFYTKVTEGHLNRFSIVYPSNERQSIYIEDDSVQVINGRSFSGPLLITKQWQPKSLGLVLYAADDQATARSMPENQHKKESKKMDKKIRAFLERHGLSPDATEEQALAFLDNVDAPTSGGAQPVIRTEPVINPDVERANVIRIERERISEITGLCQRYEADTLAKKLIDDGSSLDLAREKVLDFIDAKKTSENLSHGPGVVTVDAADKFRSAATDGLVIRSGIRIEKPAIGSTDIAGWSLLEMARHSLMLANKPTNGNKLEMVGRALTTTDFPILMANVANKSLFAGWDGAQETWSEWCATGSVPDFKTNYLPRISETSDLDEMPEGMEYKYGVRTEAQESFSIATYGKMLAITRQAIINDDLMSMTDIPRAHGEAAARKVGDLPYAVLTANAAMGDTLALFHATHANVVAHAGSAPGIASIAAGILAMGIQKDLLGKRRINIRPVYFLGPKALEGASEIFFRTDRWSDHSTVATDSTFASTRVNPYAGTVLTRIYDARLDTDDANHWYLAASKGRTITVFFLDGQQRPYMETRNGWNVDGIEYKVRIDAGAKAVDWKGLYMNDGA